MDNIYSNSISANVIYAIGINAHSVGECINNSYIPGIELYTSEEYLFMTADNEVLITND